MAAKEIRIEIEELKDEMDALREEIAIRLDECKAKALEYGKYGAMAAAGAFVLKHVLVFVWRHKLISVVLAGGVAYVTSRYDLASMFRSEC